MTFLHSGHNSKINLSAKEMLEISLEISRNFTPCFSSPMPEPAEKIRLSPSELLNIGEEVARNFAPKPSCNTPELMLLPVDPGHLYAYWNLGKKRETSTPDYDGKDQFTLRIYSQPDEQTADVETVSWFDVAIDGTDTHQQVALPDPVDEASYSAAIGKCGSDDSFIEFAHSNTIHAHAGQTAWQQDSTYCQSKNASGLGLSK
jgi:hypothetical protein